MLLSKNDIKRIKALHQKKFRDETGLFIVEGEKMVQEAMTSTYNVEQVYYKSEIGEEAMGRISALSNPSPVLAVVRKPEDAQIADSRILEDIVSEGGLFLGLDAIRDPGNLGTIIRIADWFGIQTIFATEDTVELFNPKVVQATMGAIFRVRMHYVDLTEVSRLMLEHDGRIYGTFLDGENMYGKDLNAGEDFPSMIVIGSESDGISCEMAQMVTDRLYIPPYPEDCKGSESLNAAVATAVAVAEFRRRQIKL